MKSLMTICFSLECFFTLPDNRLRINYGQGTKVQYLVNNAFNRLKINEFH